MRKSLSATMALGLSCAAMFSPAAHAQQVGTYSGTTADGDPISITVGIDPNNSSFQVQGMNVNFSAPCKGAGAGYTLNTAWGFGVAQDIVRGRARVLADDNYFNIQAVLTFPDSADITGTIDTRSPTLVPKSPRPTQAAYCESLTQAMSLTFSGPAKAPALAPGDIVIHYVKQ